MDSLQIYGFDELICCFKVVVDVGVDVCFFEGIILVEEVCEVCKFLVFVFVLLNMVEYGVMFSWMFVEVKELGFKMMIFFFVLIGLVYNVIKDVFVKIKEEGRIGLQKDFIFKKFFMIVGLEQVIVVDNVLGGSLYSKV